MSINRLIPAALLLALFSAGTSAESILIKQARVETMTADGTLEQADILIEDGVIRAIGVRLPVTAERIIEGEGKTLTPGVFNAFTNLGIEEVLLIAQARDASADNEHFTAALAVTDSFNPNSTVIPQNRILGLTRAIVAPDSEGSLFAGQVAVANLSGSATESIEADSVGVLVNFNEFAQQTAGGSRSAAMAMLRRALTDTVDYSRERDLYQRGEGRELSLGLDDLEALVPVIEGRSHLFVNVSRAADIRKILQLGSRYGLKLVLVGAEEGWMLAEEIAGAGAAVIINPTQNLPVRYETMGARLENAALLHDAGVTIMLTDLGSMNSTHNAHQVTQGAGVAVAHGLPYEAALAALFTTPAKVFDLDTPGKIDVGENADLVLWSNDPLEVIREAELVMIDGKEVPLVSRATRLRDRYYARLKAAAEK